MDALILILVALVGLLGTIFFIWLIHRGTSKLQDSAVSSLSTVEMRENQSRAGFYQINLFQQQQVFLSFGTQGLIDADRQYGLLNATGEAPQQNRYTYYNFDFGDLPADTMRENQLPLIITLKNHQLQFLRSFDLTVGRCDDQIIQYEFFEQWTDRNAGLEQAYTDFKANIQKIYALGAKIHYDLDDVRYRKEDYLRVLKEGGYCIAPEYLSFEEFKATLQTEEFYGIDVSFYLDEALLMLNYDKDYSVEISVYFMERIESHITYFGADDLELAQLTAEQKKIKFVEILEVRLQQRRELESQAKQQGYLIDELYVDPYVNLSA